MLLRYKRITKSLENGRIVCFPTDTLYALGVDAYNLSAIKKMYSVKNRKPDKPFAIMIYNFQLLDSLVVLNTSQLALMKRYLPGGVTFVLYRKKESSLPIILGEKIGVRIPSHEIALNILKDYNMPMATTSANISCCDNSTHFSNIDERIIKDVESFVEDDQGVSGIGSTVIDITAKPFTILRQGAVKLSGFDC